MPKRTQASSCFVECGVVKPRQPRHRPTNKNTWQRCAARSSQVIHSTQQNANVIISITKSCIALETKQSANLSCLVVMVNTEPLGITSVASLFADRTNATLRSQHFVVVLQRDSIGPLKVFVVFFSFGWLIFFTPRPTPTSPSGSVVSLAKLMVLLSLIFVVSGITWLAHRAITTSILPIKLGKRFFNIATIAAFHSKSPWAC